MQPIIFTISDWIIIAIVAISFLIQIIIYLNVFLRVSRKKISSPSEFKKPISVIICARNEQENLRKYLPLFLEQDYPQFEIIVVNDSSEDDSEMVLSVLKSQYNNLYYTTIPSDKKFIHSKKLAITLGVKAAKYDHLLFSDADCRPVNKNWIREMANGYSAEGKELIVGYSPYEKRAGFLNRIIRYDSFWNGVHYLGYAMKGKAMMAVGRNMGYTKQLFNKAGGFTKHIYLSSGDDDLFINQVATAINTAVVITPDSLMPTDPARELIDWNRQKSRHLTTAPHYSTVNKVRLLTEIASRQLLWTGVLVSIVFHNVALVAVPAIIIKLTFQFFILKRAAKKLNEGRIYWSIFIFDFILPIILFKFHVENRFRSKQVKWK